ncbi:MAG: UDP-2,3-diacylglucosamine diphosphatase LpxI, partial [Selenomonadaceae bacterium]|nr:UDP-2,3-diacylglucosamine diphosphatase LpxI [Selenomonadaceae bacterium]
RTVEQMAQVGATVLAIEAGKTLLVEREQMIAFADANGISIVAM